MSQSNSHLAMFAKYWRPGEVKTRLAASVGPEMAAALYRDFVEGLLIRFSHLADRRTVCFSPPERRTEFEQLISDEWLLTPQSDGNLGDRMRNFFVASQQSGFQRTILIGSDSPTLPSEHIETALKLLLQFPVVLGPTYDGGYYLVGISGEIPPIFDNIRWSTPNVWRQTIDCLQRASIRYATLPKWYDVDDADDLEQLLRDEPHWAKRHPGLRNKIP